MVLVLYWYRHMVMWSIGIVSKKHIIIVGYWYRYWYRTCLVQGIGIGFGLGFLVKVLVLVSKKNQSIGARNIGKWSICSLFQRSSILIWYWYYAGLNVKYWYRFEETCHICWVLVSVLVSYMPCSGYWYRSQIFSQSIGIGIEKNQSIGARNRYWYYALYWYTDTLYSTLVYSRVDDWDCKFRLPAPF